MKPMPTLMPRSMSIARFIASGIGSRANPRRHRLLLVWRTVLERWPIRPLRLQVVGEKPGEGNPSEPGQARLQVSRHEQGGGASVGPKGSRPSLPALKDSTGSHSLLEGGRNAGNA